MDEVYVLFEQSNGFETLLLLVDMCADVFSSKVCTVMDGLTLKLRGMLGKA